MIKLKSLLIKEDLRSESDDYYYHITLAPYVPIILQSGLQVNKKPTVSNYGNYSKGKTFLCDIGAVEWWKSTIETHGFDQFDDERFHDAKVLRIKKENLPNVNKDIEGSEDSRGNCYYVTYNIPKEIIEPTSL